MTSSSTTTASPTSTPITLNVEIDGNAPVPEVQRAPEYTREKLAQILHDPDERAGVLSSCELVLVVRNFSSMPSGQGQFVESPRFTFADHVWIIKLYPGGNSAQYSGCLSAYLRKFYPNPVPIPISLVFRTFTLGPNPRQLGECGNIDQVGTVAAGYGFGNEYLVKRDVLQAAIAGVDAFQIRIGIMLFGEIQRTDRAAESMKHATDKLLRDVALLWKSGDGADVTLAAEGRLFRAHKVFLCARSQVLRAMFTGQFKEAAASTIELHDISSSVLEQTLHFIYTGTIDDSSMPSSPPLNWWEELLAAADRFALKDLLELCQSKIIEQLAPNNVVACLGIANRFVDAVELKEASIAFLKTHPLPADEINKFDIQTLRDIVMRNAIVMVTPAPTPAAAVAAAALKDSDEEEEEGPKKR